MVANVSVNIDANIKENATRLLNLMGLDQTTAIDLFYRQIIAHGKLPFEPVASLEGFEANEYLPDFIMDKIEAGEIDIVQYEVNENGEWVIDEEKHPNLYDWAVNG
ncbi:MAG: type II toxin-antitoxin system RelB/DinJ family antitoxin [Defluviitaleaceae bacterium]|nr:type II toxin-antitoxin system RelB/DinJ family antitoxin [Defluviitaleaceae bacterium]